MMKKSIFIRIPFVLLISIVCSVLPVTAQEKWPAGLRDGSRPLTMSQSLNLAGHNLVAKLDADRNYLPNWRITVRLDSYESNMAYWWPAHNIGRWWDAILRLEESLGYKVPVAVEKAMIENTKAFFKNPDRIILNPDPEPAFCEATDQTYSWDLAAFDAAKKRGNNVIHNLDPCDTRADEMIFTPSIRIFLLTNS